MNDDRVECEAADAPESFGSEQADSAGGECVGSVPKWVIRAGCAVAAGGVGYLLGGRLGAVAGVVVGRELGCLICSDDAPKEDAPRHGYRGRTEPRRSGSCVESDDELNEFRWRQVADLGEFESRLSAEYDDFRRRQVSDLEEFRKSQAKIESEFRKRQDAAFCEFESKRRSRDGKCSCGFAGANTVVDDACVSEVCASK